MTIRFTHFCEQTCAKCRGSGEGMADGSTCVECRGTGSICRGEVGVEIEEEWLTEPIPCDSCGADLREDYYGSK